MMNRIFRAFKKLFFCFRITADRASFIKLVRSSRSFSHFRHHPPVRDLRDRYRLRMGEKTASITIRRHAGDLDIFYETFLDRTYYFAGMEKPGAASVLDLGAHTGMASAFFYSLFPGASFYCIEPDPGNLDILRENLSQLIPVSQLHIVPFAIGPENGTGRLVRSRYAYNSSIRQDDTNPVIAIRNLRDIFFMLGIEWADIIKIDIEGAESYLLDDLFWLKNARVVWMETHSEELKSAAMEIFSKNGFLVEVPTANLLLILARRSPVD